MSSRGTSVKTSISRAPVFSTPNRSAARRTPSGVFLPEKRDRDPHEPETAGEVVEEPVAEPHDLVRRDETGEGAGDDHRQRRPCGAR